MSEIDDSAERPDGALGRRDLIRLGAAGAGLSLAGALGGCIAEPGAREGGSGAFAAPDLGPAPAEPFAAGPIEEVRIGMVGVGGMGTAHVRNFVRIEGCRISAVCDIRPEHAERAARLITEAGHPEPAIYTGGETDYERMCAEEELELVFTATPWRWHVPVCVAAMESGKHAATEVPAAYTLEDCWRLVEVAEATRRHCVMMENCNYDRPEMLVYHIARQGLLGEILHAECGYLHDLRAIKLGDDGEGNWRWWHSTQRNANLYPTHGLGPVANVMDINRGDRFAYLVSMSSPSRGLQAWAQEHLSDDDPRKDAGYVLGDVNTCLIKTVNGKTIYVSHDTNLPRPYSRIHMVQGTRGIFQGYPNRLHLEGISPDHRWEEWEEVLERYDHPLWQDLEAMSEGAGHGGMDFIEDYRLIKCLREGLPTDMNVYDAAALSAVGPLTEWSVANGSRPAEFPDFTRGRWREWPELGILRA